MSAISLSKHNPLMLALLCSTALTAGLYVLPARVAGCTINDVAYAICTQGGTGPAGGAGGAATNGGTGGDGGSVFPPLMSVDSNTAAIGGTGGIGGSANGGPGGGGGPGTSSPPAARAARPARAVPVAWASLARTSPSSIPVRFPAD
jgi:hypothetical protein